MANAKKVTVDLLLNKLIADRNQYKPYISELSSSLEKPVYVRFLVPEEFVEENDKDRVVVTPDGVAYLLGDVAKAVDAMHHDYVNKLVKRS